MFASACVSPMDVTKTRMQVLAQPGVTPSIVAVMKEWVMTCTEDDDGRCTNAFHMPQRRPERRNRGVLCRPLGLHASPGDLRDCSPWTPPLLLRLAQGCAGGRWCAQGGVVCGTGPTHPPTPRSRRSTGPLPAWKTIGSSLLSGALASIVGTPFDVALVRMQSDSLKPVAGACSASTP